MRHITRVLVIVMTVFGLLMSAVPSTAVPVAQANTSTLSTSLAQDSPQLRSQEVRRVKKTSKGYVRVFFEDTNGVPKSEQAVLLWQGKKRIIVRKAGVVELPNRKTWKVVPLLANAQGGFVVEPIAHRGNVIPVASKKKAKRLRMGAATLRLNYSNRTEAPAKAVTQAVLSGPVAAVPGEGDVDAVPGWSLLSVPVQSPDAYQVGEPIVIGRDVKGFPNGFVGKIIRVEGSNLIVEAVNPLTVFTNIEYNSTAEGSVVLPPLTRGKDFRAKTGFEAKCDTPDMRKVMSIVKPELTVVFENDGITVSEFGYSLGVSANEKGQKVFNASVSRKCTAMFTFPDIKGPAGVQINTAIYGYISISGTGSITFTEIDVKARTGALIVGEEGSVSETPPTFLDSLEFSGSVKFTLIGIGGHLGIQWPASIEIAAANASIRAELSVEAWIDPSADIIQFVAPSALPDCAIESRVEVGIEAGLTAREGAEISFGSFSLGGINEQTPFTYSHTWGPFFQNCIYSTAEKPVTPTPTPTPPTEPAADETYCPLTEMSLASKCITVITATGYKDQMRPISTITASRSDIVRLESTTLSDGNTGIRIIPIGVGTATLYMTNVDGFRSETIVNVVP